MAKSKSDSVDVEARDDGISTIVTKCQTANKKLYDAVEKLRVLVKIPKLGYDDFCTLMKPKVDFLMSEIQTLSTDGAKLVKEASDTYAKIS